VFLPGAVNACLFGSKMGLLKLIRVVSLSLSLLYINAVYADHFPKGPNLNVTPGSVCDRPSEYRYPEQIAYCERNVDVSLKKEVIQDYNQQLGYQIQTRSQYKIDHFIPLCMGGSNHKDNLWPQHKSVYEITDSIEFKACEKMKAGKLNQRMAIDLLKDAKLNLDKAKDIEAQINAL
jgi:hypothetical protein